MDQNPLLKRLYSPTNEHFGVGVRLAREPEPIPESENHGRPNQCHRLENGANGIAGKLIKSPSQKCAFAMLVHRAKLNHLLTGMGVSAFRHLTTVGSQAARAIVEVASISSVA